MLKPTMNATGTLAALRGCALTLVAVAALAGCATTNKVTPEQQVRELATERWQALLADNAAKAYEMTAPSYRKLRTQDVFTTRLRAVPVKWLSAQVVRVDCHRADACTARIAIESQTRMPTLYKGKISSGVDESWVLEDGRWWILERL